jgi:hypothetical protein
VAARKGAGAPHRGDDAEARKIVEMWNDNSLASSEIQINRVLTADSFDGCPWPPSDGREGWTVVRRMRGFTLWRSIGIAQPVPPPHGCADFVGGGK